jgi:hypothetical protein
LNFDSNEIKEKYNKIIIGKYYNNYYRKLWFEKDMQQLSK